MGYKKIYNLIEESTNKTYSCLYEKTCSGEKRYIKMTKETLSYMMWTLGGATAKIVSLLINNINENNNHVYFGRQDIINYFKNTSEKITKRTIDDTLDMLSTTKVLEKYPRTFLKEISEHELAIDPYFINACRSNKYKEVLYMYDIENKELRNPKKKPRVVAIQEPKKIPIAKFNNGYGVVHALHVKNEFFILMRYLNSKRVEILSTIFELIMIGDKNIYLKRDYFSTNKSTISEVTKLLRNSELLWMIAPGYYKINQGYISTSSTSELARLIS